ncbi:MAG: UDP-3-O-(3-hydroxymyristoyl)glucosamine N-acyltransferase [Acidobacteriota bacterium]
MGKEWTLKEIADRVRGDVAGDPALIIKGVMPLETARDGFISFLSNPRYKDKARTTEASAIIVSRDMVLEGKSLIRVENPYLAFAIVLEMFHAEEHIPTGISPDARYGKGCNLGKEISIAPLVTIGDNCVIADRVRLFPGVHVADDCFIGAETIIYANVSIYRKSKIGSRVIIHSGTVVGSDGYGFATDRGKHHKIPQVGGVVIEDDVEIGSNCSIDRGTMGDTVIRRGTKIDNLVQIAHNVVIGEDSLIVAQVGISGSTEIGKGVIFAGQSGAAGHLKIGDGAIIAAKSAVFEDIPPKAYVAGYPAIDNMRWKRSQITFERLPEFRNEIVKLRERIDWLEKKLRGEG